MKFYLGTHLPNWLELTDVPLFVSHGRLRNRLGKRARLPRALGRWCLDSRGYSELKDHGRWTITAREYVSATRRYASEIGNLDWAAPQGWMCEPWIIAKTGLSVVEHQSRTIASVLDLREIAPEMPWVPVLQGWHPEDYLRHVDAYLKAGIDLAREKVVGIGTLCRRQATSLAEEVIQRLWRAGISLHGFGFKVLGLRNVAPFLCSGDSMAWSFAGRKRPGMCPDGRRHKNCANCLGYALQWFKEVQRVLAVRRSIQYRMELSA